MPSLLTLCKRRRRKDDEGLRLALFHDDRGLWLNFGDLRCSSRCTCAARAAVAFGLDNSTALTTLSMAWRTHCSFVVLVVDMRLSCGEPDAAVAARAVRRRRSASSCRDGGPSAAGSVVVCSLSSCCPRGMPCGESRGRLIKK
jgi:hypothetical protein